MPSAAPAVAEARAAATPSRPNPENPPKAFPPGLLVPFPTGLAPFPPAEVGLPLSLSIDVIATSAEMAGASAGSLAGPSRLELPTFCLEGQ